MRSNIHAIIDRGVFVALVSGAIFDGALAQEPDMLKSPSCLGAQQRLQEAVARVVPGDPKDARALEVVREDVAAVCLGLQRGVYEHPNNLELPPMALPVVPLLRPEAAPLPFTAASEASQ